MIPQICFETKFTDQLSIYLSDLEAFSDYTAELSACADNHHCGKSIAHTFSTPAGCKLTIGTSENSDGFRNSLQNDDSVRHDETIPMITWSRYIKVPASHDH